MKISPKLPLRIAHKSFDNVLLPLPLQPIIVVYLLRGTEREIF